MSPDWGATDRDGNFLARCVGEDPEIWFDSQDEDLALAICNTGNKSTPGPCPVRHECLIFALINNNAHGVWGGLPEYDRKQLRKHVKKVNWAWYEPTPKEDREDQSQPES
jgi:WhiB family redox-sensing transcriptional regulator